MGMKKGITMCRRQKQNKAQHTSSLKRCTTSHRHIPARTSSSCYTCGAHALSSSTKTDPVLLRKQVLKSVARQSLFSSEVSGAAGHRGLPRMKGNISAALRTAKRIPMPFSVGRRGLGHQEVALLRPQDLVDFQPDFSPVSLHYVRETLV